MGWVVELFLRKPNCVGLILESREEAKRDWSIEAKIL